MSAIKDLAIVGFPPRCGVKDLHLVAVTCASLPPVDESDEIAERWLPVRDYEGFYEVSSHGGVRSARRKGSKGGLLAQTLREDGYFQVDLYKDGRRWHRKVHQLVADSFHGPCPPGQQIRHWDGDSQNNFYANLVYGTASDDRYDQIRVGTHFQSRKTHCPAQHEYTPDNTAVYEIAPGKFKRACKACMRQQSKDRYAQDPEHVRRQKLAYIERDPERHREQMRRGQKKHRDKKRSEVAE